MKDSNTQLTLEEYLAIMGAIAHTQDDSVFWADLSWKERMKLVELLNCAADKIPLPGTQRKQAA